MRDCYYSCFPRFLDFAFSATAPRHLFHRQLQMRLIQMAEAGWKASDLIDYSSLASGAVFQRGHAAVASIDVAHRLSDQLQHLLVLLLLLQLIPLSLKLAGLLDFCCWLILMKQQEHEIRDDFHVVLHHLPIPILRLPRQTVIACSSLYHHVPLLRGERVQFSHSDVCHRSN